MISRATSSFHQELQIMFPPTTQDSVEMMSGSSSSPSTSLLFNLSVLKDKLNQVQTLVGIILSPNQTLPESTSLAISSMNSTIQEIIVTATSMMFTCQHLALTTTTNNQLHHHHQQHLQSNHHHHDKVPQPPSNFGNIGTEIRGHSLFSNTESEALDTWFGDESYHHHNNNNNNNNSNVNNDDQSVAISESNTSKRGIMMSSPGDNELPDEGYQLGLSKKGVEMDDIIELDASDLLAKYTHYCHVCGKGFKRDANLRMHMRAHGDEYKTSAALSKPIIKHMVGIENSLMSTMKPKKYSCPQQGCRWNQKHHKFQPLKSMICAKNHYKRSHCPKMYVCKRCNLKQFSVLSDLRTHEKHCGDLKWQCSCGTTFSRKDKLMGHVAMFVGHHPASTNSFSCSGKMEKQRLQMHN